MNRVIVSFFALLAAAPLAAQEQTPRVLSLDEALEITLSGSPVIEASRYEEKAAQQERRAAEPTPIWARTSDSTSTI